MIEAFMKKRAGRRQSVGRRGDDAGVDAVLATAVPPVRDAAANAIAIRLQATDATPSTAVDELRSLHRAASRGPSPLDVCWRAHKRCRSRARVGDYVALMKPRVMSLVVFTALVGMAVAPGSLHPLIGFTALLCIAVGAGAAGALNMWYDADIDARHDAHATPAGADGPRAAGRGTGLRADARGLRGGGARPVGERVVRRTARIHHLLLRRRSTRSGSSA